ncbi:MAG: 50S ribosomal protein L17 [Bacteroidales bacterium]|nr:50S ribosomal protein L17 [Bacteroidales bacterium]
MRHRKNFNHLGRKTAHRKAMLSNMASSLIMHKRIETTTAKAKALKRYIEPLITRGKDDSTHARRVVFSYLQDKEAVSELFREVGAKVADRPGGYTRIIRLGNRLGDNADMCLIELVDYNENLLAEKAASKKSTSRRRRGSKPKTQSQQVESTEAVTEEAEVATEVTEAQAEELPAAEAEVAVPAEETAPVEEEAKEEKPTAEAPAEEEKKDESTDEAKKEDNKD